MDNRLSKLPPGGSGGKLILIAALAFLWAITPACGAGEPDDDAPPEAAVPAPTRLSYQVINRYMHDTTAFTEGLSFYHGQMFESTGSPESPANSGTWIASVDPVSGKYDRKVDLGNKYFGEGITFLNGRAYQLTWTTKKGFVYDADTFEKIREFSYGSDGWGLTNDGVSLIMSTGSSNLYYLHPDSLNFVRMLAVQDNNGYVNNLNELEFIGGYVYANKWLTSLILKIDTATGFVVGELDLSKQVEEAKRAFPGAQELNGIAYDSTSGKTFVTGKKWPYIYEIKW